MKLIANAMAVMEKYICDWCLGRCFSQLLSGYSNKERGKLIRTLVAMVLDSGEKLNVDLTNFYGFKFRNLKLKVGKPGKCYVCKNFFEEKLEKLARRALEKMKLYEFETYLIGSIPTEEMVKAEARLHEKIGIEFVELIKTEINREIGKLIEKWSDKRFDLKSPDITAIVNLKNGSVRLQVKSLYVYGEYKKLVRGIPQATWYCSKCHGKGCIACKGKGVLYPTSVQEIVAKHLLRATKAKKSKLHGSGREDIDARCLDYRPFVIELVKPRVRRIKIRIIAKRINENKKVRVKNLRIVKDGKELVRQLKSARYDKTYLAYVTFEKPVDEQSLERVRELTSQTILQRTPSRVLHRRTDKVRKRSVKSIRWKMMGRKRIEFKIRAESGLYVKELITGDRGRTKPNLAEILNNKVKQIKLDVIKIHR